MKSPDEAGHAVSNMETNIRSRKFNILWLSYQQGQIFEKIKANEKLYRYGKETRR